MKALNILLNQLEAEYGLDAKSFQLSSNQIQSDLAFPCFKLAKSTNQAPNDIAQTLAYKIKNPNIVKAEAINGYLNLWLSSSYLASKLNKLNEKSLNIGQESSNGKTVIVDYFSPNLAKPLSIGHLRNLLQGRAVSNLYKILGYEVITDNHLGDWGLVFGMWVVGFKRHSNKKLIETHGLKELGRIYILTQKEIEKEKQLGKNKIRRQVDKWLLKLENKNKIAWRYHKFFTEISLREINQILRKFEIKFDHNYGESFYHDLSFEMINHLKNQNIAVLNKDRALVVDLKSEKIDKPMVIQKSNGSTLYTTTDIATLKYRQDRWQPHEIIYVVGLEQQFHFRQLFALNRIAKISSAKLTHYGYGLIEEKNDQGKRQKMSSRNKAILLTDLIKKAYLITKKMNNKDLKKEDIKTIAFGAITFQEFLSTKNHNSLFDWQKAFDSSDMSGPYVQYAVLRLRSILTKTKLTYYEPYLEDYDWRAEHDLLIKVLNFEDVLQATYKELEPSKIAFHLLELAKLLNRYYETTTVLDEQLIIQSSRLWLIDVIHRHMIFSLQILGIKIPSRM